jgi:hypothetical protein
MKPVYSSISFRSYYTKVVTKAEKGVITDAKVGVLSEMA